MSSTFESRTNREERRLEMHALEKKFLLFVVATTGICIASLFFWQGSNTNWSSSLFDARDVKENTNDPGNSIGVPSLTTVEVIEVEESTDNSILRFFSGVITPSLASDLGFQRTGKLDVVHVDLGGTVTKGQVLASLDVRALEAEKAVVEAELAAAVSVLEELEAGPRQQTVDSARAKLQETKSFESLWRIRRDRKSQLLSSNAASQQDLDDARLQLSAAQSRVVAQQQILSELEAGTRPEKIAAQKAVVRKLRASIVGIEVRIDESILKAPFDGAVSSRYADPGATMSPGQDILRIVDTDNVEVWIGLPPKLANSLQLDKEYPLLISSKRISAKLISILPELDPKTRTQSAIFALSDSLDQKPLGQLARFEHYQNTSTKGFWIPKTALTYGIRGLWSVYLLDPIESRRSVGVEYVLRRQDVEVLQNESEQVLVRGTIQHGDRIVASGVQKLVDGQRVATSTRSEF